jgi:hypothetical protein
MDTCELHGEREGACRQCHRDFYMEHRDPYQEHWPICELHGQAEGACLQCHRYDLVRDAMPSWVWRMYPHLLESMALGCDSLAYLQARKIAHVARVHAVGRLPE